jgi:hypothetical protein
MCSFGDLGCAAGEVVGGVAKNATDQWAQDLVKGVGKAGASLGTFWVHTPSATFVNDDGSLDTTVSFLLEHLGWIAGVCAFVGFLIGAAKLMIQQRGQAAVDVGRMIFILAIITGFSLTLMQMGAQVTDSLSAWFIDESLSGAEFGAKLVALVALDPTGGNTAIVIVCALVALLVSLIQVGIMFGRYATMTIMGGLLPTTASFTNTAAGQKWFNRIVAFTIAVYLYKPAASIVYAAAFMLTADTSKDSLVKSVAGIMLMIMSVVAGPALFRFISPGVAAAAGGGGGAAIGGAIGSAAVGAINNGNSKGGGFTSQSSSTNGLVSETSNNSSSTSSKSSTPSGSVDTAPSSQSSTQSAGTSTGGAAQAGAQGGTGAAGTAGTAGTAAGAGGASGAAATAGPVGAGVAVAGAVANTVKATTASVAEESTGPAGAKEVD